MNILFLLFRSFIGFRTSGSLFILRNGHSRQPSFSLSIDFYLFSSHFFPCFLHIFPVTGLFLSFLQILLLWPFCDDVCPHSSLPLVISNYTVIPGRLVTSLVIVPTHQSSQKFHLSRRKFTSQFILYCPTLSFIN